MDDATNTGATALSGLSPNRLSVVKCSEKSIKKDCGVNEVETLKLNNWHIAAQALKRSIAPNMMLGCAVLLPLSTLIN